MEHQFLPNKLREILSEAGMPAPEFALRAGNCPENDSPGETYLINSGDHLLVFSRVMGENDYRQWSGRFHSDITDMHLEEDRFNSFLIFKLNGQDFKLKYSSFEAAKLRPLLDKFNQTSSTPPPIPHEPVQEDALVWSVHPFALLVAGLMYAAGADDELGPTEERYIRNLASGRENLLDEGMAFYNEHSFEEYLQACQTLNGNVRLCILTHMTDLMMSDGTLHSSEQHLLNEFADAMNISKVNFQAVNDVMLIKNRLSLLF